MFMAAYVEPALGDEAERARLADMWHSSNLGRLWVDQHSIRPQFECIAPPWWSLVSIVGSWGHELDFKVTEPGDVMLLVRYGGPYPLRLCTLEIYRLAEY